MLDSNWLAMELKANARSPTSSSDSTGTRVFSSPKLTLVAARLRVRRDLTVGSDIEIATNTDITKEKPRSPASKAKSWVEMNMRTPVNPTFTRAKAAVSMQVITNRARRDRNKTGNLILCNAEPSKTVTPPEIPRKMVNAAKSLVGGFSNSWVNNRTNPTAAIKDPPANARFHWM